MSEIAMKEIRQSGNPEKCTKIQRIYGISHFLFDEKDNLM